MHISKYIAQNIEFVKPVNPVFDYLRHLVFDGEPVDGHPQLVVDCDVDRK